jgi:lactose/L-arabinose transport system permease protein
MRWIYWKGALALNYKLKQRLAPFIFLAPFLIIFAIFMAYPIAYSFVLSFTKFSGGSFSFVGIRNFKYLLTEQLFYQSLLNTFIILIIQVPIMTITAMIFGSLMNSALVKFKGIFRMFIFMPVLIDAVSYSIIFSLFFNSNGGLVNNLLKNIGLPSQNWFGAGNLAMIVIMIAITWKWTGYNSIIMLAGLQNVSKDLYEAASIDGANTLVQFWKITIPQLKPVLVFSVFNSINGTLQLFTEPNLLTQGGPANSTMTIVLYLYKTAFKDFNFGVASAGSYILALIIAALTLIQLRVMREDKA